MNAMDKTVQKHIATFKNDETVLKNIDVSRKSTARDAGDYLTQKLCLEREKMKANCLKQHEAQLRRKSLGLPFIRSLESCKLDEDIKCDMTTGLAIKRDQCVKMTGPDRDKPQNHTPWSIIYGTADVLCTRPEAKGTPIPFNEPYISSRLLRAKLRGAQTERKIPEKPISNAFPQLDPHAFSGNQEEFQKAVAYSLTSSYQSDYKPHSSVQYACRLVYPMQFLDSLPHPLRSITAANAFHPATSTWKPKDFDDRSFELRQPRFGFINEPRPYEFSSVFPRIDQIPTYSGQHASADFRAVDDDPYREYKPLSKVRSVVPAPGGINRQQNVAGYTGCVVDHIRRPEPPDQWHCSVRQPG